MRGSIKGIASVYMIVYFLTLAHQLFPHHHNIEADTHPKDHAHDHHSQSILANFLDLNTGISGIVISSMIPSNSILNIKV